MLDQLGQEIKEGSIVAYATREGTKQVIRFAVVYEPESQYGMKWRIMIRPLDFIDVKSSTYRLHGSSNNTTETVHIQSSQVYVVPRENVPKAMYKALEDSYCRYVQRKTAKTRLQDKGWYIRAKEKSTWQSRMVAMNDGNNELIDTITADVANINKF